MPRFFSAALSEAQLRQLYCDRGLSTRAVAATLGCSETAVRNRLVQLGIARRAPWAHNAITAGDTELRRLYVEERLPLSEIAARSRCSLTTVWRRLRAVGVLLRPDGGAPKYAREDFSGNLLEKAYLIGFRLGDLHVELEGDTVVVKCTSTREEQVALFRQLFEPYGRVYTDEATIERRQRKSIGMYARLNRTFDFLLPKGDSVPAWILAGEEPFFAFLGGYSDAEGYFKVAAKRRGHAAEARLEIRSYDQALLTDLADGLIRRGIACPSPGQRVAAGYVNRRGVKSNQPLWGLAVCQQRALKLLFERVGPYLRHRRRRDQMLAAQHLVNTKTKGVAGKNLARQFPLAL